MAAVRVVNAARLPRPGWVHWRSTCRPGAWSPEPDHDVARFPGAYRAADALIGALGQAGAVPLNVDLDVVLSVLAHTT